jgi:hypothetical protein
MAAQQNLLALFDEQFAEKVGPRASSDGAAPNPFRKQSGICTSCTHEREIEQRIYWCHSCDGVGCWDWLQKHKD